jgi:Protein of unknown function (DUF3499)
VTLLATTAINDFVPARRLDFWPMGRLCERPGCSEVAVMAYGFDADRQLVWLAACEPDADRMRAGALCRRHADALIVPRGWTLDDRREHSPRLFRVTRASRPASRPKAVQAAPQEAAEPTTLPWTAEFDVSDDLDGVLAADSPLLARAFRGTSRRH